MLFTMALLDVQVTSALRAQTFAILPAQCSNRSRQQHLLTQSIFQQQALTLIITDLGLRFADRYLIAAAVYPLRPEEEIKVLIDIVRHRLQTTRTAEFQVRLYIAHQSNVFHILMVPAMFDDQFGTAIAMQLADLTELGAKLDFTGLIILVELQFAEFQFAYTNQHGSTG